MYGNANKQVELLSKIIRFAVVHLSAAAIVLPKGVFCFFMYFYKNMGEDAFELPFPTW